MRRLHKALAATGGLTVLAFGLSAPPAQAASCPDNYVCMWEDPNYSGELYVYQPNQNGRYEIDGWDGDNEISSVINNTHKCIVLYANDGWTGRTHSISYLSLQNTRYNLELNGYDNEAESYGIFNTGC